MIRIILTIAFMLNLSITFGQVSHKLVHIVGSTKDSTIQVLFEQVDTKMKRFIIFENNSSKDTIILSMTDNKFHSNTCKIEQIQIDGKGLKEIHITWSLTKPFGLGDHIGGQTSWGEQRKFINHEIWNLDTKERLFSAVSFYSFKEYTTIHGVDEKTINTHSFWSYDFSIGEDGRITISNTKRTQDQIPDNAEGNYIFADGKYHKQ
ncbi:MAG: hypothetical protein JXR36_07870 [Bacteroidales bacterium]|nr:hypothetical protein [Bacteroidales bacterium]